MATPKSSILASLNSLQTFVPSRNALASPNSPETAAC
jgi:hypothetical protein